MNTMQPPYPDKFKPYDIAVSTINVSFIDGTQHKIGQKIVVTPQTVSYYNVWYKYYNKL